MASSLVSTWTPADAMDGASACTTLKAVATAVGARKGRSPVRSS